MAIERDWDKAFLMNSKGSSATRDRAYKTWSAVREFGLQKKWDLAPGTISPKQMRLYLEHRSSSITARSVQNEASHLRRAIAGAGRTVGDVRDPLNTWSSSRMGLAEGSRIGGKTAADPAKFEAVRDKMPTDIRACLDLVEALGLRRKEGVMAAVNLAEWAKQLASSSAQRQGVFLLVNAGTKGGRPREVFVPNQRFAAVSKAVDAARQSAAEGGGSIVHSEKLHEALAKYTNCLSRLGLTGDDSGHGLRRAFAHQQYAHYRETGLDQKEALRRLSQDLGHGDNRGRWVWNNYLSGGTA